MNYYTAQEDGSDEDNISWDSVSMEEWARNFLEEHRSTPPSGGRTTGTPINRKKMGSSAITNILPRMERLDGPYGLYATVYGIQTKVVHVAHPVPARAILTGAGVIETGGLGDALQKHGAERNARRQRSSMRLRTGSTKHPAYDHFKNFSGEGVFTANGSDWKAKRASVMHCLLRNGDTEKSLEMEANRAADSFEREVAFATAAKSSRKQLDGECKGPVMNIVPMLQRSLIALIYRLITHHDVEFSPESMQCAEGNCSDQSETEPPSTDSSLASMVEERERDVASEGAPPSQRDEQESRVKSLLPTYLDSVTKIRMIILAQSRSFWYLVPRWAYRTFSPMHREEERTMGPIREFARLTCEHASPGSPLALLSQRSSHSAKRHNGTFADASNIPVAKDLLDEAITLLFAGQDTSAATLSWTLHLLSLHPDKQEKVADEVLAVVGQSETNGISKSMISQLPYLDAVIKESMRLYPVAPFIVRKLTSDVTIPMDANDDCTNKTISLPASMFACIWIYALHRNPKLWHRADDFLPERWIDPELQKRDLGQQEYGAYIPFAAGPRNCLGQPLAHVILRILLARIMRKYVVLDPKLEALRKISESDGAELGSKWLRKDMQAGFTVLPSNGLRHHLVERV
ncbi:hypothetical protein ACHAXT_009800 [Thalassiosira profunda]